MNPCQRIEGPSPFRWVVRFSFLSVCFLGLAGCQLVGSSGGPSAPGVPGQPASPMPEGRFQGFLEIEGGRIEGVITLTPRSGDNLEGFFEAPPDLVAIGRGRYRRDELRLELSYEGACPGKMTLEGRWEEGPGTLSGSVEASDCTGKARGTFLFSPRQNSFLTVGGPQQPSS